VPSTPRRCQEPHTLAKPLLQAHGLKHINGYSQNTNMGARRTWQTYSPESRVTESVYAQPSYRVNAQHPRMLGIVQGSLNRSKGPMKPCPFTALDGLDKNSIWIPPASITAQLLNSTRRSVYSIIFPDEFAVSNRTSSHNLS
jgi:hypothetical protein